MSNHKQPSKHFSQNSVRGNRKKNTPQCTSAIAEAHTTFALQINTVQRHEWHIGVLPSLKTSVWKERVEDTAKQTYVYLDVISYSKQELF